MPANDNVNGKLMIIGGAEDKKGDCIILKKLIEDSGGEKAKISIMTTATKLPYEVGREYRELFMKLGVKSIEIIDIQDRFDAHDCNYLNKIVNSTCVFFTGGDQLRITSILGGTPIYKKIKELYNQGAIIAGTSAGASVMSTTMIVNGPNNETIKKCTVKMAPGLGLIDGVVVDQHFAQRGRIGRLITAIAQNPNIIGIGIDENTAIRFEAAGKFEVIGANSVTIIDGSNAKVTNVSELKPDEILALSDIKLHIIPSGYGFDIKTREVRELIKEGENCGNMFN